MKTETSRRAVLAGAAALPALAVPALAVVGIDPILAVIEAHKAAFLRSSKTCRIFSKMSSTDPGYERAVAADRAASDERNAVEEQMTNVRPTTMAGVLALLDYVDAFNCGEFGIDRKNGWASEHLLWVEDLCDDDVKNYRGKPLTMPFALWILRNAQAALRDIAST